MHLCTKLYDRQLQPICQQWGLTRCALDILLFLGNNPGLDRAADVVRHRGITKSHASAAIRELEEKGLILRRKDASDGRNARLGLTEAAVPILKEGQQCQQAFFTQLFAGLTPADFDRWRQIIATVCGNIANM